MPGSPPALAPAIVYRAFGGPEVLEHTEHPVGRPGPGEVLLRHRAISVNFSDINARRGGFYRGQQAPALTIPGNEAVGVIEQLGDGVDGFAVGDRVAYAGMGGAFFEDSGAYATYRVVPAARLVAVPDGIDDTHVAALFMKGLTASAAINRFFRPSPGDTVLVHAAASGVGLILVQWARHCGACVIGTVGSATKAGIARRFGCHDTILYREEDFVAAVRRLCPAGVAAVYDGVGKDTFLASLDCLRPFGKLINYGNASGPPPPLDVMTLSAKGSLSVARLGVSDHIRSATDYQKAAAELFSLCRAGAIRAHIEACLPLAEAAEAHRRLEAGAAAGALVLIP